MYISRDSVKNLGLKKNYTYQPDALFSDKNVEKKPIKIKQ